METARNNFIDFPSNLIMLEFAPENFSDLQIILSLLGTWFIDPNPTDKRGISEEKKSRTLIALKHLFCII